MPNHGTSFRDALINEILAWQIQGLTVYKEVFVGSRFVGQKRNVDIIVKYEFQNLIKTIGIEAKYQGGQGTAYQKLTYTVEDAKVSPIPILIVFSGTGIKQDVKSQLIASGIGIEVVWDHENGLSDGIDILKQRIQIELGLNWLLEQDNKIVVQE